MRSLDLDLRRFGGLATRSQLWELGHRPTALRAALASGRAHAVGRTWIASSTAPPDAVRAVSLRGVLGGESSLRSDGVWVSRSNGLCIATAPNASRLPPLADGEYRLWRRFPSPRGDVRWRVGIPETLVQALPLIDGDPHIVATIDSALHRRRIGTEELDEVMARMPRRVRRLRKAVDGRAESGLESILRLGCLREGWRVASQVRIAGVGRVDLLVDGWLVAEADGEAWHGSREAAAEDRRRNRELVLRGYRWHRFGYAEIMNDLEGCLEVLRALLAAGRPPRRAR